MIDEPTESPAGDEPAGDEPQPPAADDAQTDELRESLTQMRSEADRIATLGSGQEQVEAAEQFAEGAGRLDEQIGAAARAADDDRNS